VPAKWPRGNAAPDSIQFNLVGMSDDDYPRLRSGAAATLGIKVQIFRVSPQCARILELAVFWGYSDLPEPARHLLVEGTDDTRLAARGCNCRNLDLIADLRFDRGGAGCDGQSARFGT